MMKKVRKYTKNQRGYILPLSLVIMLFGSLVVGSLFTYIGASLKTRSIARDNLNAYYAAGAGVQLVIAKLIQADYEESGELAPLPERFDDGDGTMEDGEYYTPSSDPYLFPGASNVINGYEVRMTVEHGDRWIPDYVDYQITAYAFEPGASGFDEAKDKVVAVVRQTPYPIPAYDGLSFRATIISWQRQ